MKVSELTIEELRALIEEAVEEKLSELLGDPDKGLELKDEIKQRLTQSLAATKHGARGIPAEQVARELGLKWADPVLAEVWNNEKDAAYDRLPRTRRTSSHK